MPTPQETLAWRRPTLSPAPQSARLGARAQVALPYFFAPFTEAIADQVNANFAALATGFNTEFATGPFLSVQGGTASGPLRIEVNTQQGAASNALFPELQFRNTWRTLNDGGLWRFALAGSGNMALQLNVATAGDFATFEQPIVTRYNADPRDVMFNWPITLANAPSQDGHVVNRGWVETRLAALIAELDARYVHV